MANDPANGLPNGALALSGIGAGPPQEAEYHAVYAAVTATERGRWFLTEFAKRNRHAETRSLVAALARIEAAVGADARSSDPVAISDLAAAAENLRDSVLTLRERGGEAGLCDALDAAARQIGAVSFKGADGPDDVHTAPADADETLILQDREKFAAAAAALAASLSALGDQAVGEQNRRDRILDQPAPPASADQVASADQQVSAAVIPPHDYAGIAEPPRAEAVPAHPRWYIEPPDFVFDRWRHANGTAVASSDNAGRPHSLLPRTQFLPSPEEDPAELFEPAATIAIVRRSAAASVAEAEHVLSELRAPAANAEIAPSRIPTVPPVRAAALPVPVDPLAALHALTEDELLALFG